MPNSSIKSAVRRRVPWRTVVGEDSAVVACCGWDGHGVMMDGFVVVDPGPTLVPVTCKSAWRRRASTGTVDWCFEPVRQTFDSPCPPHDEHFHTIRRKGALRWK